MSSRYENADQQVLGNARAYSLSKHSSSSHDKRSYNRYPGASVYNKPGASTMPQSFMERAAAITRQQQQIDIEELNRQSNSSEEEEEDSDDYPTYSPPRCGRSSRPAPNVIPGYKESERATAKYENPDCIGRDSWYRAEESRKATMAQSNTGTTVQILPFELPIGPMEVTPPQFAKILSRTELIEAGRQRLKANRGEKAVTIEFQNKGKAKVVDARDVANASPFFDDKRVSRAVEGSEMYGCRPEPTCRLHAVPWDSRPTSSKGEIRNVDSMSSISSSRSSGSSSSEILRQAGRYTGNLQSDTGKLSSRNPPTQQSTNSSSRRESSFRKVFSRLEESSIRMVPSGQQESSRTAKPKGLSSTSNSISGNGNVAYNSRLNISPVSTMSPAMYKWDGKIMKYGDDEVSPM